MNEITPIDFKEANAILKGGKGEGDMYIHDDGEGLLSCWKIPLHQRLKLLFSGKIYLCVKGKKHPPVWLDTEGLEK